MTDAFTSLINTALNLSSTSDRCRPVINTPIQKSGSSTASDQLVCLIVLISSGPKLTERGVLKHLRSSVYFSDDRFPIGPIWTLLLPSFTIFVSRQTHR